MSGAAVNLILEKIGSKDKDFRYMATSDLLGELGKESFRVDADLERRLAAAVAAQLDDVSGDISGLAVKCLALLVRRIGEANAVAAINDLCSKVVSGKKDSTRDIASIALKTVIAEVPPNSALAAPAAAAIVGGMLQGVAANKDNTGLASDALDILGGAAAAFGPHVAQSHGQLLSALLELVDDPRPALRKRALHCLAGLSPHLSEALLRDAAAALLAKLEAEAGGGKAADARVYVQALGGVSRATGHRLGPFLPRALPLVISCYEGAGEGEAEDELRDQCLQALESFVSRSPAAARPHLPEVLSAALGALRHDPNFADGMDGGGDEAGSDEDDDAGSDDGYSDDEDASWKVRRAAAKLIAAAVAAYPDALPEVYSRAAPDLLSRFREREESVKTTVMGAYCDLVKQVASAAARHYGPDGGAGPLQVLRSDVPAALKAAAQQLAGRDVKTRAAAFGVLRALGVAAPEEVAAGLGAIVPGVLSALSDRASSAAALKIEALAFLQPLLAGGDPETLAPHLAAIGGGLFEAAGERYYKVSAEALRCCEALVRCLRPAPPAPPGPGAAALAGPLFDAASARLAAQDQDQEVKEAAIGCVAAAVAALGDQPAAEGRVEGVLATLLERLRNETTRLPAVRAAAAVAASPLPLPALAGGAAGGVVAELTGFLRKANRRVAFLDLDLVLN